MDEREELENLRKEFGVQPPDERDELEQLRAEFGQSPETQDFAQEAPRRAWSSLVEPLAKVSHFADTYVGAPIRAGLQATIDERNQSMKEGLPSPVVSEKPLQAAYQQFGEEPSKAPTWGNLSGQYFGTSDEPNIPFTKIRGFGTPQARFEESKISASDIGGGFLGMAADPINAIPGMGPAKVGLGAAEKAANVGMKVGVNAPIKSFARAAVGLPEDTYNYYKKAENWDRLKGKEFEGVGGIRSRMLDEAGKIRQTHDDLIKESQAVDSELKEAIQQAEIELSDEKIAKYSDVQAFQNALEADKKVQIKLDQEADEALAKVKMVVPTKYLKQLVQKHMADIMPVTQADISTVKQFQVIHDQIDQVYGPFINGPMLRDWMQRLRRVANWEGVPGSFDQEADRIVKNITTDVSDVLKRSFRDEPGSPIRLLDRGTGQTSDYEKIMDEMAARIKSQKKIVEYFGKDEKGLQTLKKLLNISDPASTEQIEKTITQYAVRNNHEGLLNVLLNAKNARERQKQVKDYGTESLFPDLQGRQKEIKQEIPQAEADVQSISRMSESGIENVINNLGMHHGGKIYNQEQLENLERLSGQSFGQEIQDQGVLREFTKDRTRGSKRTTPGTIGGALTSSAAGQLFGVDPVTQSIFAAGGAWAGNKLGQKMDIEGGRMARSAIDAGMRLEQSKTKFFEKMKNPSGNFAKYARTIDNMARNMQVPTSGMILYHQILWNNDPEYRKALEE